MSMSSVQTASILLVVGARFLGHAYPLASLMSALQQLTGFSVHCCLVPLAEGSEIPAANYLSRHIKSVKVYSELEFTMNKSSPIRDYADLIRALGLDEDKRITKYALVLRRIIETANPFLVITDSLPGIPQLSQEIGVPVIAMRSHALKQRFDTGLPRDVFLDTPIDKKTIETNNLLATKVAAAFGVYEPGISIDDLYYRCPTITPGFDGFDVRPANSSHHVFMRLGTLPDRIVRRQSKNALVYIRDPDARMFISNCLREYGFVLTELDDYAESRVNFWARDIQASIIISHGGHGMASAGLYQQLPHIAIADTDDRYTIGSRIESAGAGVVLDARRKVSPSQDDFFSALKRIPKMRSDRKLLNSASKSPQEVAKWCLSAILDNRTSILKPEAKR